MNSPCSIWSRVTSILEVERVGGGLVGHLGGLAGLVLVLLDQLLGGLDVELGGEPGVFQVADRAGGEGTVGDLEDPGVP
jgi:hypothetical protein